VSIVGPDGKTRKVASEVDESSWQFESERRLRIVEIQGEHRCEILYRARLKDRRIEAQRIDHQCSPEADPRELAAAQLLLESWYGKGAGSSPEDEKESKMLWDIMFLGSDELVLRSPSVDARIHRTQR
jgi:hypothetical protein